MNASQVFMIIAGILILATLFSPIETNMWKWFLSVGVFAGLIWLIKK